MARLRVDFPQPDLPTRPRVSPGRTARSTPSTARTIPIGRRRMPLATGKWTCSARTSSSGATSVMAPRRGCRAHTASTPSAARRPQAEADLLAGLEGLAAARRKLQPGVARGIGTFPPITSRRRPRGTPSRGIDAIRARVTDAARARSTSRTRPLSTMRPAYITATRVPISATMLKSCDEQQAPCRSAPARPAKDRESAPGRWRRGQSSARSGDEHLRLAGKRHRDHRPLLHSARELVRILPGAPFGRRDAAARSRATARLRAALREALRCRCRPSAT